MENTNRANMKHSFLMGSLTSSAGVFISKLIGLFYVVPFTALAGEENMIFYSNAYNYYSTLLQVCSAGLPFAIAAIVARYVEKDDYRTVLLVRRLGMGMLAVLGFFMMVMLGLFSGPLSVSLLGSHATAIDVQRMRITFLILSLALFLVPFLSSYRGFYQGLKEFKLYADSQVIEQFARVFALLALSWICIRLFHLDRIWAIYMGVAATSVGALCALFYYVRYDRKHIGVFLRAARRQERKAVSGRRLLMELFAFGLPYLISGFLGNSQALINTQFFIPTITQSGMPYETAKLMLSIIQLQCNKITSIPQVLSIGFSTGLVPYMTISYERRDWSALQKNVRDCLDTVCYIAFPLCYCIFALARPIYYVMYGGGNLDAGENALMWSALLALVTTITPICTSMLMTLHLRRESLFYLCIGSIVKVASFFSLVRYVGYSGAITSSVLCSLTIIYLSLARIQSSFHVRYGRTLKRLFKMTLSCLCMQGVFSLLHLAGLQFIESSRLSALGVLAVYGVLGLGAYVYISSLLKLPQAILHLHAFSRLRLPWLKRGKSE